MRKNYDTYAPIYQQINQPAWSERMARWTLSWLAAHQVPPGHLIDWGCGDGAAAMIFAVAGWQVTGVDQSPRMLALARERAAAANINIAWYEGDLRTLRLHQRGTLATAFYDTLNYLTSIEDLQSGWQSMATALEPGGYAIADVNTPYEYATAWNGKHVVTADTDTALVLNRLRYNDYTKIATGRIVWFAHDQASDHWRRGAETHMQRAHSNDQMQHAIAQAGLRLIECCTPQGDAPTETATRLIYIAQKDR